MERIFGELIEFKTNDGLPLHGFLSKSKKKNKRVIIFVHGMSGNFYSHKLTLELTKSLIGTETDFFTVNNRGNGLITRFHVGKKKKTIGTAFEKFEECLFDIEGAIKTMQKIGYNEIILAGHSTGCQKIVYYMAKKQNKKIKALILLSPADDYSSQKEKLGKKFQKMVQIAKKMIKTGKGNEQLLINENQYSAKRWLSTAEPTKNEAEIFNYTGKLRTFSKVQCPILAIFGSKEKYLTKKPIECLNMLQEKTNSRKLITVEISGASHGFNEHETEVAQNIIGFISIL